MLHARLEMLKSYLTNLQPSYLTTPTPPDPSSIPPNPDSLETNHPILRSIQALLNRLPLVVPADEAAFEQARLAERSDVSLVDLLGHVSKSVRDTREVGRKFWILEQARTTKKGPMIVNDDFLLPNEKADLLSY